MEMDHCLSKCISIPETASLMLVSYVQLNNQCFKQYFSVEKFMKENKLKSLGLPKFLGSGSHEANGDKYRFLVIEKLGSDIWQLYLENGQKLPGETVFQIAIQIVIIKLGIL